MTNEELAKAATLNIMKIMAIKWGILLGLNAYWRHLLKEEEMKKQIYIEHEDLQDPENGTAIFGPFKEREVNERLNDYVADMLADSGPVDAIELSKKESKGLYINSRRWWMKELRRMERGPRLNIVLRNLPFMPWS